MAALEKDYEEVGMDSGDMENEDDGDEYWALATSRMKSYFVFSSTLSLWLCAAGYPLLLRNVFEEYNLRTLLLFISLDRSDWVLRWNVCCYVTTLDVDGA